MTKNFFLPLSKLSFVLAALVCAFWLSPAAAYAQVVINELHPHPSTGNDWIELKNVSENLVGLSNWTIESSTVQISPNPSFTNQVLLPNDYFVIEVGDHLKNNGDHITLRKPDNTVVDEVTYPEVAIDKSWSRIPDGTGSFSQTDSTKGQSNDSATPAISPEPSPIPSDSPTVSPTPLPSPSDSPAPTPQPPQESPSPSPSASPSLLPSPVPPLPSPSVIPDPSLAPLPTPDPVTPTPQNLQLSEIMVCQPTHDTQWIEVYNPDAVSYDLQDWKVFNSAGQSRKVSGTIPAQSYGVLAWKRKLLSHDGDTVTLQNNTDQKLFSADFPSCQKDRSFIYYNGKWQETLAVTKGSANIFQDPDPQPNNQNTPSSSQTPPADIKETDPLTTAKTLNSANDSQSVLDPSSLSSSDAGSNSNVGTDATASAQLNLDDSGKVLGASTSATSADLPQSTPGIPSAIDHVQDGTKPPQSPFANLGLILTLCGATICLAVGGYGVYAWYIKNYQKRNLDV